MSQQAVGILLAAGSSQRFGSNKLLHPVIDNTPMLLLSAQKLASVLPGSVVVINNKLQSYQTQLQQLGLQVIINEQPERGMGSSIACGVRHCSNASSWLISLADMPHIKTETLSLLVNKLKTGADIVAPLFEQQRGHPVGFNAAYKEELMALNEDVGARTIIHRYRERLELIPTNDKGVILDIDHPDDLL